MTSQKGTAGKWDSSSDLDTSLHHLGNGTLVFRIIDSRVTPVSPSGSRNSTRYVLRQLSSQHIFSYSSKPSFQQKLISISTVVTYRTIIEVSLRKIIKGWKSRNRRRENCSKNRIEKLREHLKLHVYCHNMAGFCGNKKKERCKE